MTAHIWFIQAISNPLRHRGYVAGDLNGPDMKELRPKLAIEAPGRNR